MSLLFFFFFFFKQKTAYEMRISDWSSDVCSSDLSNLLAHHLKVLEGAGLIVRTRSEGDRRRSYVRMVPEATRGLDPQAAVAASRVVFVCTANSARSQLAEHLWRARSAVPAASAGTAPERSGRSEENTS